MSRLHDWLKNIDKKENVKLIWIKIGKLIILDCIAWVATRGYPNFLLKQKQDKHAAKAFFFIWQTLHGEISNAGIELTVVCRENFLFDIF